MLALQMPSTVALIGDLAVHHAGDPLFLYLSDLLAGRADEPRLLTLMAVLVHHVEDVVLGVLLLLL